MVGSVVQENVEFLSKLAQTKSRRVQIQLIRAASRSQLLAILETCINILKYRFPLKNQQKRRLKPYANYIRRIARKRTPEGVREILQATNTSTYRPLLLPVVKAVQAVLRIKDSVKNNGKEK